MPIYFCLNSGRCGSTALVRLLRANGIANAYHELPPDLIQEGVDYYYHRVATEAVAARLLETRSGVYFEANNRLFSLARPLKQAFPQARFLFLFRDGRDVVRSGLERGWYGPRDRFRSLRVGADADGTPFMKTCRYWADINRRILQDLQELDCEFLYLRFEDLINGRGLRHLEQFLHVRFSRVTAIPRANQTNRWSVPGYADWTPSWRRQFDHICGPMMKWLGYATSRAAAASDAPRLSTNPTLL